MEMNIMKSSRTLAALFAVAVFCIAALAVAAPAADTDAAVDDVYVYKANSGSISEDDADRILSALSGSKTLRIETSKTYVETAAGMMKALSDKECAVVFKIGDNTVLFSVDTMKATDFGDKAVKVSLSDISILDELKEKVDNARCAMILEITAGGDSISVSGPVKVGISADALLDSGMEGRCLKAYTFKGLDVTGVSSKYVSDDGAITFDLEDSMQFIIGYKYFEAPQDYTLYIVGIVIVVLVLVVIFILIKKRYF